MHLQVADRLAEVRLDRAVGACAAHGQQRDLVVEVDEALDDDAAAAHAAAALSAYCHAGGRRRPGASTSDWPLPDDDITGLTTHG